MEETKSTTTFGERMSIEEFLKTTKSKTFNVFPRENKPGYYYFATERTLGYVPKELGFKMEAQTALSQIKSGAKKEEDFEVETLEAYKEAEKIGSLFITQATTEGFDEPMFMLCESKRESVFSFSLD